MIINSRTPSSNADNSTTVLPAAPSNLSGVAACHNSNNLSLTDSASDETGCKIG
ncbi:hypothetical protein [Flavobacterium sp.]|uniref:hypothetical protein n=1 Tax=Flavobacterium sp. TaxID=239 RepID=UPI0025DE47E0|nr:hypothetical protein [Flavobacterium sp.]